MVANCRVDACPKIIWMAFQLDLVAVPRSQDLVAVPRSQDLVPVPRTQDLFFDCTLVAVPRSQDLVFVPRWQDLMAVPRSQDLMAGLCSVTHRDPLEAEIDLAHRIWNREFGKWNATNEKES